MGTAIGVIDHQVADQLRAIDVAHQQAILPRRDRRLGPGIHDLPSHGDRAAGLQRAAKWRDAQVLHLQIGPGLRR